MQAPMAAAYVGASSINQFYRGVRAGIYPAAINRPGFTRKWSRLALEQNANRSLALSERPKFDLDYELGE